jgi:oligopeptidase B
MTANRLRMLFALGLALGLSIGLYSSTVKGPSTMFKPASKIPHTHEIHGDIRQDEYFWMRERDTPPVLQYLRSENQRTSEALAPVRGLESGLYHEMRARIKEDDSSVPVFDTGFYYYTRYNKGQEYEIHCRKKGSLESAEEVILDENQLAAGKSYFEVGDFQTSPDQRYLAYAVDSVGRRIYDIYVKDLSTGRLLQDRIAAVSANVVWAADNKTLFYVRQDPETLRSYQVYRYEIGSNTPVLVYEEKDTTYNVSVEVSKQNSYVFMAIQKRDSSEWRVLDARHPSGPWHTFLARENNHEYSLVDGGDKFYILTNWQARNFRIMTAPVTARSKADWKELVPVNTKIFIESLDVYKDFLIISERENGLTQIRLRQRIAPEAERLLKFPDPAYEVAAFGLPDYASETIRFKYESLVQPPSVYDENVETQKRELRKVREVPGYNRALYESQRIWAKAKDGSAVPMSLLYKKGLPLNGHHPTCFCLGAYSRRFGNGPRMVRTGSP